MPYCKCPRCANVAHLHLKISRYEWYRTYFPTHDPRQPAPAICARCWVKEHGLETGEPLPPHLRVLEQQPTHS
ncbi:MAG: hypothetical protein K8U03_04345 [Planctomycetia bacterium]|nr:hypothetical protein [Planctomycetia bacterium]